MKKIVFSISHGPYDRAGTYLLASWFLVNQVLPIYFRWIQK